MLTWRLVYDDPVIPPPSGGELPKTLTDYLKTVPTAQDELNKMMAENRKKLTQQNKELMDQLQTVKEQFSGTAQEKEALEQRIEQLQNQFLSKEELAKRETDKSIKEHQKAIEKINNERDAWQQMYTQSRISRELLDAAISVKAVNPDIIVDMLSGKTHLAPRLVDGQPNGEYEVKVKFQDIDEHSNPVLLELSPEATVKRMQELSDKYGNLFVTTATGGMGASSGMGGGKSQPALQAILKDPVVYAKWRKENPDLDVSKLRR